MYNLSKLPVGVIRNNSDYLGAIASGLCLIHCLATPFLFIAQSCTALCCESSPVWWQWIDYFFVVISFIAVYRSASSTSNIFVGRAMWISWIALVFTILNERLDWLIMPAPLHYLPALVLITLHIYNQKFCQCSDTCVH